jgi:hypothetical protein
VCPLLGHISCQPTHPHYASQTNCTFRHAGMECNFHVGCTRSLSSTNQECTGVQEGLPECVHSLGTYHVNQHTHHTLLKQNALSAMLAWSAISTWAAPGHSHPPTKSAWVSRMVCLSVSTAGRQTNEPEHPHYASQTNCTFRHAGMECNFHVGCTRSLSSTNQECTGVQEGLLECVHCLDTNRVNQHTHHTLLKQIALSATLAWSAISTWAAPGHSHPPTKRVCLSVSTPWAHIMSTNTPTLRFSNKLHFLPCWHGVQFPRGLHPATLIHQPRVQGCPRGFA